MTFYHVMRVVEIRTKIVSVSGFAVGTTLAIHRGVAIDAVAAALLFLALLLVDMGTTAFNSFFDFYTGVDANETNRERDKVLVHDGVAPGAALLIALALFVLAAIPGLILTVRVSWLVAVVGLAGMVVGFLYNGGPLPISSTPLGELFAGGFLGFAVVLLAYGIHARSVDSAIVVAAVPQWIFVASILTANNSCDRIGDARAGRHTLSILLGSRGSTALLVVEQTLAWAGVAWLVSRHILPGTTWWFFAPGVAVSVLEYVRMVKRGFSHATKPATMGSISKVFAVYTVVLVGGVAASLIV